MFFALWQGRNSRNIRVGKELDEPSHLIFPAQNLGKLHHAGETKDSSTKHSGILDLYAGLVYENERGQMEIQLYSGLKVSSNCLRLWLWLLKSSLTTKSLHLHPYYQPKAYSCNCCVYQSSIYLEL